MANGFQKATKKKVAIKAMLGGVSGAGKTYSALRLATGIVKQSGGRIAFIDTEGDRGLYYAEKFDYDRLELTDHSPEAYIEAMKMAEDNGYTVCIIDSTSHEWEFCLTVHDKMPGNSYTNWAKVTPRHEKFINYIIQSPMHIICTARGKAQYVLEDKNGKQIPKKAGMGIKQREGMDFEFTVFLDIDQESHVASTSKDNTGIFDGKYEVLTEDHGAMLYKWANSGEQAPKKPKPKLDLDTVESVISEINSTVKELMSNGKTAKELGNISKQISGSANFNSIKDIEVAKKLLKKYKSL